MYFLKVKSFCKTADSDTVSTYQVSSVQLVTDKKLKAFNKQPATTVTHSRVIRLRRALTDLPPSGSSIDPESVAV